MKTTHTAPMEVFSALANGPYESEPYEVGWASEALAVVYIREVHGDHPTLSLQPQISADGQRWIDFGAPFEPISQIGGYYLALTQFGAWLRLAGTVSGGSGDAPAFYMDFYWVLKG